jgi:hypothetical protein
MMEALRSSEASVLTRATRRNNPEDTILQHKTEFAEISGNAFSILFVFYVTLPLSEQQEYHIV